MGYYNRYTAFMADGEVSVKVPFVKIPNSSTDKILEYDRKTMRCDTLSYKFYGDPNYGWLILQANPEYSGYEFSIPDGARFRIPYPLDSAIQRYENGIKIWKDEHEV